MKSEMKRKIATFLPTEYGDLTAYGYADDFGREHIALVMGEIEKEDVLCRVHSECLTGEVFGSLKCDCKEQLETAFDLLNEHKSGVILYLRQEGRGIGLIEKLKAYELQHKGLDTVEANIQLGHQADERDYNIAYEILRDLNVKSVKLITNNPDKVAQLEQYGIKVTERVPLVPQRITQYNKDYLSTKAEKMKHILKNI